MEFMFTGASSVTTTLLWLVWHIASDPHGLKAQIRAEAEAAAAAAAPVKGGAGALSVWLDGAGDGLAAVPVLDAALRETLRMYPPIHIGRLSVKPFTIRVRAVSCRALPCLAVPRRAVPC